MNLTFPRAAAVLAGLAALILPSTALAAGPWSAAAPIPGAHDAVAQLVVTSQGNALTAYSSDLAAPLRTATLVGASAPPGGSFTPARTLGHMTLSVLRAYGSDHVLAAGETGAVHPQPAYSEGRPAGTFTTPRRIGPKGDGYVLDAAVDARGDAAVLLRMCTSTKYCTRSLPYLVTRRAGHSFGRAVLLDSHGTTLGGAVAIDPAGDVLATWARPTTGTTGIRSVYSRVRVADGHFDSTRRLGSAQPQVEFAAQLASGRAATVAWVDQGIGEGSAGTPATVQLSTAAAGHAPPAAHTIDTVPVTGDGRYVSAPGVQLAGPLLAWTGYASGHFVVRAAPVSAGGLGTPQTVSDPATDSVLAGSAGGPSGSAVVLIRQGVLGADPAPGEPTGLFAAERAQGATAFGPLEAVAQPSIDPGVVPVAAGPDGFVAVWGDSPAGGSAELLSATRPF